jgi:kumamolisin
MTRASVLATCLALGAIAGAVAGIEADPAAPGARIKALGPARSAERVEFTVLLALPGAARLRGSLAEIQDPRSSHFRQYIDPNAFGRRFGISATALARVERSLLAGGLRITASYPQRTALGVSGTVAAVSRLLHVGIAEYADGAGHRWHTPEGTPVVPPALAPLVSGVTGLDTRPRWHARDVPLGGLTPLTVASAYDIAALRRLGFTGRGLRIAVISFSDFNPSEPRIFDNRFSLTGPPVHVMRVDGGTRDTSGADEANLDIEVIHAVAPDAQVDVYEVPQSSSSYTDVINRIVADRRATIISSSWGQCELALSSSERAGDTQALAAADAAGVSMFVASGDSGAYDCQAEDLRDHRLSVDWPASSAGAIGVGGTRLYLNVDGSYQRETGWEDPLSHSGGGGGVTRGDALPSWQRAPGVRTQNGRRLVPDVSADADPGTGWLTYSKGRYGEAAGTSAAAPFWAASMLLVQQYAARQRAGPLGYVNPMLYALASAPQPFAPFHDVTEGGNRYYQAAPGWDPATGLGSPDLFNLARDVVKYLRAHRR